MGNIELFKQTSAQIAETLTNSNGIVPLSEFIVPRGYKVQLLRSEVILRVTQPHAGSSNIIAMLVAFRGNVNNDGSFDTVAEFEAWFNRSKIIHMASVGGKVTGSLVTEADMMPMDHSIKEFDKRDRSTAINNDGATRSNRADKMAFSWYVHSPFSGTQTFDFLTILDLELTHLRPSRETPNINIQKRMVTMVPKW